MSDTEQQNVSHQASKDEVPSKVQNSFGPVASAYVTSAVHASGPDLAWVVEAAALTGKERVLDVATGTGHTALAVAPYASEVIALDLTSSMLQNAQQLARERQVHNISFIEGNALSLPFADNSFEVVTCRQAAHHFSDVAKAVKEWRRVLKPGGRLVLVDTISPEEPEQDTFLNTFEVLRDPSHVRDLRISEWLALLSQSGWTGAYVAHSWDIPLDVPTWTRRMRTPEAEVKKILQMFTTAPSPIQARFHIRISDDGIITFTLPGAVIVSTKA
ncbi:methyltransferase domain-containing protein [Ktedonosporobacter rubrisoli]|uniref:Methyltransferase domain-containing protein n=1 Tax=Ktedonosporobacter rubrisoli TaxID=2509675 RepID=A0A4P6JP64_KTERU|nr:methyltransferase domain-containing protein [Ktedonosporobacter rubrisoli]QBD77147.1 methyltransferase domain-containing protein [Ktedonosporobacter rubrisoli]